MWRTTMFWTKKFPRSYTNTFNKQLYKPNPREGEGEIQTSLIFKKRCSPSLSWETHVQYLPAGTYLLIFRWNFFFFLVGLLPSSWKILLVNGQQNLIHITKATIPLRSSLSSPKNILLHTLKIYFDGDDCSL